MNSYETSITSVETGLTAGDHQAAMSAYETFLELSYKFRMKYAGSEGRERNTQAGYFNKTGKDTKEVFHYTLAAEQYMRAINYDMPAEAEVFLDTAAELYQIAANGLKQIFDEVNPLLKSIHFPTYPMHNNHLRFLRYAPGEPGQTIAVGHYDQATVTVALCESHPGLRIGNGPDDIKDYDRDPNQSVTFPGYGWLNLHQQLGLSTDRLPAWHDVIQPSSSDKVARLAIILFANPAYINTMPGPEQTARPLASEDIAMLEARGVLGQPRVSA